MLCFFIKFFANAFDPSITAAFADGAKHGIPTKVHGIKKNSIIFMILKDETKCFRMRLVENATDKQYGFC